MLRNPILLVALPVFALTVPFYATVANFQNLALASSILLLLAAGGAVVIELPPENHALSGTDSAAAGLYGGKRARSERVR